MINSFRVVFQKGIDFLYLVKWFFKLVIALSNLLVSVKADSAVITVLMFSWQCKYKVASIPDDLAISILTPSILE